MFRHSQNVTAETRAICNSRYWLGDPTRSSRKWLSVHFRGEWKRELGNCESRSCERLCKRSEGKARQLVRIVKVVKRGMYSVIRSYRSMWVGMSSLPLQDGPSTYVVWMCRGGKHQNFCHTISILCLRTCPAARAEILKVGFPSRLPFYLH